MFKPGFTATHFRCHEKRSKKEEKMNSTVCSKTGLSKVLEHTLPGTALVRMEDTSVSAEPLVIFKHHILGFILPTELS